ncbi:hypothetical protein [uncultured Dialister sp.]|uniref:hypothetical protein n=1 Tax=uncultured Dialister sp. TaxID=278064 RepID=UPI00262C4CBF|nr:hypothetical protein [uncultured Dialister sp.]
MEEQKEALIQVIEHDHGRIEIIIDREAYRPTMTSLSQAMCGAFDIAGEHDKVVYRAIRELTERGIRERNGKRQNFPQGR